MSVSKISSSVRSIQNIPYATFSNPASGSYVTGTFVDTSNISWRYWIMKSNLTFTCVTPGIAEILVIGGGGTGAAGYGGGGGAGGVLSLRDAYFKSGDHIVIVGAGGVSYEQGVPMTYTGHNGRASRIGNYYAPGGGGGFKSSIYLLTNKISPGSPGGSGGGGEGQSQSGFGMAAPGFGNNGGAPGFISGNSNAAGGGGGAGAPGDNGLGRTSTAGAGGIGVITNIITTSIATSASVGQVSGGNLYFAGGGGSYGGDAVRKSGGLGGGGQSGTTTVAGVSGTAFTGGGGGGGGDGTSSGATQPGSGGSGVVIVRVRE